MGAEHGAGAKGGNRRRAPLTQINCSCQYAPEDKNYFDFLERMTLMKKFKKVFSLLLVMVMALSLVVPALAVGTTGSITITNATVGKEYKAYKIFDATVGTDGEIAYTIDSNSDWYSLVKDEGSPFTVDAAGNVSLAEDKNQADVLDWLKAQTPVGDPVKSKEADAETIEWTDVPFGYYYITSTLGTVITVSPVDSAVTVIDKNQTPGWEPEDPDDETSSGKYVSATEGNGYAKESTASIGDTAYFKINAHVPKYAGKEQVHTYTFVDTLANGFTYNDDMELTITGLELTDTDYKITVDGQKITIELYASKIESYPADASLDITYSAKVDKDAVYDNVNTVSMDWTVIDPENPENPGTPPTEDGENPEPPEDSETHTYSFGFNLQKYKNAADENNKLTGAEFRLYDAATGGNEIKLIANNNGTYRVAEADEEDAGAVIQAGTAKIFGLKEGTYYLEETKAPDGYNKLTARQEVIISKKGSTDGYLTNEVQIINNSGAELPGTGGIGTTIFYVAGGILMTGAVVLLITKKKMLVKKG